MAEVILSPGWATYLCVSDEDKQTPERSFAMQRQRIQEQLLSPSDIKFKTEFRDMLTGTSPNRKDYQQMLAVFPISACIVQTASVETQRRACRLLLG